MNQRRLFLGCFVSMIATALVFAIRGAVLNNWGTEYHLTEGQKGMISGAGLYPFAITIILFSLIQDKIGYGRSMALAFLGQIAGAIITITATSWQMLYAGTFIYALGNGIVEAVINPVVATIYGKNKTHWLNILHAGWPAGLVLGGLLSIAMGKVQWQWQMALTFVPIVLYGLLLLGQRFPVQERVGAGVSYRDMLKEFGWASAFICFFLLTVAVNEIITVAHSACSRKPPRRRCKPAARRRPNLPSRPRSGCWRRSPRFPRFCSEHTSGRLAGRCSCS